MTVTENPGNFVRGEESSSSTSTLLVLVEDNSAAIPDSTALLRGTFAKVGDDLLITGPTGETYLVQDFFLFDPPPLLTDGAGLMVSGEVVARIAQGQQPI